MFQIRIHGRGGQGVVTAAEVLSVAAFLEEREAQAFPSFGSERMGAPVMAFCRIDDKPIRMREPIAAPDAVVVQDPTLLSNPNLLTGLTGRGFVLINSERPAGELKLPALPVEFAASHIVTIGATEIARRHSGKPIVNLAMLGGLLAVTGVLQLESLRRAILEKFPGRMGEANIRAAEEIHRIIRGPKEILTVDKLESSYQTC
jgi:pyruvate ferredoxin oxidoreductase gamma subunit